ncbi:hypothetical protein MXAN_5255 [Myxococcus xanthus DK 1622]|uniref:YCII-related domain-containing protein n=2 Tax=Myxococcus TaxID=32 RepID=Q1D1R6_MYXXD|nr:MULTISPECIES: YciI family protein [Myxococcus]ABF89400.1 hypothetical protein MXAN_5255 [Myxococcus xanthus DK 1622]NOJ53646.1 hypothetical protein [Myxococcus xanthus]QPM77743.1 hypothetical protein I5Q59_25985 [Myxococcus xanthus]QQR42612.1 hypothetical protein JKA73_26455 [Myxococcus xanthus]QVW66811.1 hypothetical protein JTM82_31335 [Myxococcus xanthus DZ2]
MTLTTALLLLTLGAAPAQPAAKKFEFDRHYLVLLERVPGAKKLPEAELAQLQKEHLAHLTRMGESGKMVLAGPFDEQDDVGMRGACIYRTATKAEAKQLAEQDPMVKAGRLKVQVMAWYTEKGYLAFPKAPPVEDAKDVAKDAGK